MVEAAGFGEGSKISVVFDESGEFEVFFEFVGDVEGLPGEIAEPSRAVIFDDARHGDAEGDYLAHDEVDADLLKKKTVEFVLVDGGLEFDGMENFASCTHEGDEGFGAADVDTEIHNSIILHFVSWEGIAKTRNAWYSMEKCLGVL